MPEAWFAAGVYVANDTLIEVKVKMLYILPSVKIICHILHNIIVQSVW
jgi:hypothetical protein